MSTVVELLGLALLVVGVGVVSIPAALIVAGVVMILLGEFGSL